MAYNVNTSFDVEGYLRKDAMPIFENALGVSRTLNMSKSKTLDGEGAVQGYTAIIPLPTKLRTKDTLTFDTVNSGDFIMRQLSITIDKKIRSNIQMSDPEKAVYAEQRILTDPAKSMLNEMANTFENYNVGKIMNNGYRFVGDASVSSTQMLSVQEVQNAIARFQSYGCPAGEKAYFVVPYVASAKITGTAYSQFTPGRNDRLVRRGEIGQLEGVENVTFMKSNFLTTHIAGTAADDAQNLNGGYYITSITPNPNYGVSDPNNSAPTEAFNTSTIVLEQMTAGTTIVAGDLIDIGYNNSQTISPIFYNTSTGYTPSENPVQCRVITGGTVDGSGNVTIVVQPSLIYDATQNNPFSNLTRAIVVGDGAGADTVRIVKSHRAGLLYFGSQIYVLNPKLPSTEPFSGSVVRSKAGYTIRAYYGHIMGNASKQFVKDAIVGTAGNPEASARVIFPLNIQ